MFSIYSESLASLKCFLWKPRVLAEENLTSPHHMNISPSTAANPSNL